MIKEIVEQWDERKHLLESWLASSHPDSYQKLVEQLVRLVLCGDLKRRYTESPLDPDRVAVVDHGDYQGTQLFLVPIKRYQPSDEDYVWLSNHYGSCSGCDALESIREYSCESPTAHQVSQYMTLALHMVQRMKWLCGDEEEGR